MKQNLNYFSSLDAMTCKAKNNLMTVIMIQAHAILDKVN